MAQAAFLPGQIDPALGSVAARHIMAKVLTTHEAQILTAINSPPQTDEVSRAAPIYPALCVSAERTGQPQSLLEVGCSAGLNLNLDRFSCRFGSWSI